MSFFRDIPDPNPLALPKEVVDDLLKQARADGEDVWVSCKPCAGTGRLEPGIDEDPPEDSDGGDWTLDWWLDWKIENDPTPPMTMDELRLQAECVAMHDNLTATQARCTELLLECRRYKAALAYLKSREGDYPILSVLLEQAGRHE